MGGPEVVIIVPVLRRPHRAAPLAQSVRGTSDARVLFVATAGDEAEIEACRAAGGDVMVLDRWQPGDYARKVNRAIGDTDEPLIFTGADDLRFHVGWLEAAKSKLAPGIGVVGTNDLGNPAVLRGDHATHSLVTRRYVADHGTIDQPGFLFCQEYAHNFCDTEMVDTARSRGAFAFARDAIVEHLHPHWKGSAVPNDPTYVLGQRRFRQDQRLYIRRRRLWMSPSS